MLLVDDEILVRESTAGMLEDLGFEVIVVTPEQRQALHAVAVLRGIGGEQVNINDDPAAGAFLATLSLSGSCCIPPGGEVSISVAEQDGGTICGDDTVLPSPSR